MSSIKDMHIYPELLSHQDIETLLDVITGRKFKASPVFNPKKQQHLVNPKTRRSKTCNLTLDRTMSAVKAVVQRALDQVNTSGEARVTLSREHVTIIRYDEGDFFLEHQDHRRFPNESASRYEGHLLVCLEAPEAGGELVVRVGEDEQVYRYTIIGGGVLFDKGQRHEALPVTSGCKMIMSIDVDVTRVVSQPVPAEIEKWLETRQDMRIQDTDIFHQLAQRPELHHVPVVLLLEDDEGNMAVYDSRGLLGTNLPLGMHRVLEACAQDGVVRCAQVMSTLQWQESFDDCDTDLPVNLSKFAPYSHRELSVSDWQVMREIPVVGKAQEPMTISGEPEWCNEEYDCGAYSQVTPEVLFLFSAL